MTNRIEHLAAALRGANIDTMTTPDVIALCERALPDCTADEIYTALRSVAEETFEHADELVTFKNQRRSVRA